MLSRVLLSLAIVIAVAYVNVHADELFVRGREKSAKGEVKSESAKEVSIGKETVAGSDVLDVQYDTLKPVELYITIGSYKIAKEAEKEVNSADLAKRKAAINRAIKGYTDSIKLMEDFRIKNKLTPHKYAGRHFEYRIAALTAQQELAAAESPAKGIALLQDFKAKHKDSWQINQVMPLIAQLQLDDGKFKEAEETLAEMAEMPVFSDDIRREAELKVVQIAVKAGNIDKAQKRLDSLAVKAKGNVLFTSRIKMTRAELLVGLKKTDDAMKLLTEILKENNDKTVKALAHNSLGECLFKAERYNDAVWEFLWVDTIYNQDKAQHAKALYYLWQTFDKLNNAERAQECREMLLTNAQFTGTEYQRLGQTKQK
jgi:tetratricopeptide (TPR) repeat protein